MTANSWKTLPLYQKIKYIAEIIAILGGLALIFFYSRELSLLDNQLKLNEKQLKSNEDQLRINKDQLKLFTESLSLERSKSKARLEVWQRNTFYESVSLGTNARMDIAIQDESPQITRKQGDTNEAAASKNIAREDDRTQITLLFRNLSHRPTAIIDVYVREGEGILEGRGYKNRITLPIQIEPWGVRQVDFRIEKNDEKRMTNILIKDIEDNEIVIRNRGQKWIKVRQKE